jgi:TP901 family phage tail tape measure protein
LATVFYCPKGGDHMGAESIYRLYVEIAAVDKFSSLFKSFITKAQAASAQMKELQGAMKLMGASSAEIQTLSKSLDDLARARKFDNLANDLKQVGMSAADIHKLKNAMNDYYDQQQKLQKTQGTLAKVGLVGVGVTGAGAAIAYGITKAAEQAAQFQTAIVGASAAMKLTNQEATKFSNMAMNLGIPTRFSAVETSQILNAMYTAGLTKQQVLNPAIAREYVNFADVQAYRKGENPEDAVHSAIGMTHLYGIYSSSQITPFLNQLNAVLMNTHDSISQFATTFKYVAGTAKNMGMNSQDALAATAWLGRMGMGSGRGGTNLADFMRLSVLGAGSKAATQAMYQAGLVKDGHSVFTDAKGNFVGIPQSVQIMQDLYKRYHGNMNELTPLIHTIWGVQGGRIAQLMMSPGAADQYKMVQNEMRNSGSIDTIQESYNKTLSGQTRQLKTTIEDIVTQFGLQLIPVLTKVLGAINPILGAFLKFEQNHTGLVKVAAVFATIAASAMLVVGPLIMLASGIGLLATSLKAGGIARTGLKLMGAPIKGAGSLLGKAGGVVKGVAEDVSIGTKMYGQAAIKSATSALKSFGSAAANAAKSFGTLAASVGKSTIKSVGSAISSAGSALKSFGSNALNAAKAFGTLALNVGKSTVALVANAAKTVAVKTAQLAVAAATRVWAAVQAGLDIVLSANPISLIIIAIAALIAIVVVMITHWRQVISVVESVWDKIKQFASWIASAFVNLWHQAVDWGRNLIQGLWNGISGMAGWFVSQITGFVGKYITGPIKSLLGIHSPSRVFMEFGGYLAQGLAIGMTNNAHLVSHAANHLSNATIPTSMGVMSSGSRNNSPFIGELHIHANDAAGGRAAADAFINAMGKDARLRNMSTSIGANKFAFR